MVSERSCSESKHTGQSSKSPVTTLRKVKKPLLERKRRERINRSLANLKIILVENIRKQGGTQMCKLDKADILEMTVRYLKTIQYDRSVQAMGSNLGYLSGFRDCAQQTAKYLHEHCACNLELTSGLYRHLSDASQRFVTSTRDLGSPHQGQTTPTKNGSIEVYMGMHCNSLPGLYQAMTPEQTPFESSWTMLSNTYPYGGNNHGDSKFVSAESEKIADKSFGDCSFVGEISANSDQSSEDVWRPW